jgi:hypothetical protein
LKRFGYLFEKITSIDNIQLAIHKASKGKKKQRRVIAILDNEYFYANQIRNMLINDDFIPCEPKITTIKDAGTGKERKIYKPKFYPDQIIHWSLMLVLEPILMKGMYRYSCGSIPGRGTSFGQKVVRKWMNNDRKNTKYCFKMDVKKFYNSIDNDLMKACFKKKIKDKKCLNLIFKIIDSIDGQPIGYYTSPWFSNFFLQGLDHYIKEKLKAVYYVRYVDDLVIFGPNKRKLHKMHKMIKNYLARLKLSIKKNWQVFRTACRDVDFLGVRFFRDKTILRKRNALKIRRRVKKIIRKGYLNEKDASAVVSYWGWIKRTNSYTFYNKYVSPFITIELCRKVVSVNAKIRQANQRRITNKQPYDARLQTNYV